MGTVLQASTSLTGRLWTRLVFVEPDGAMHVLSAWKPVKTMASAKREAYCYGAALEVTEGQQ